MAEELTRSLTALAERGDPRGAAAVLEDARAEAVGGEPTVSVRPTWRRGAVVAFGTAIAILVVVGATILIARPFGGEEMPPATTGPPVVPTTIPVTPIPNVESAGLLNDVNDLAFAPDGSLWAATSAGLVQWDVATGDYLIFGEDHGLPAGRLETVEVAPDGTVWALTSDWIARYDGSWRIFSAENVPELNGQLGSLAVDDDGVVWVLVASEPIARFDGAWAAVAPPPDGGFFAAAPEGLAIGADGTVWVGTFDDGVFAFDGATWKRYGEADGAPARAWNVVVAPGGDVWAWANGIYTDPEGLNYVPPTGFARFDGTDWTTFTVDEGLLDNEGSVVTSPDGTVWVVHTDGLSHFDGAAWTTAGLGDDIGGAGAVAGADGTLWLPGSVGIVGMDGTNVTELVVPPELATPPLLPLAMIPTADQDPVRVSTVVGDLEFTTMQLPLGREFWLTEATPHGPVSIAIDGSALYWATDELTWEATRSNGDPWRMTMDGEDVILYGDGFARYAWEGTKWIEEAVVDLPGNLHHIAFGPLGAVAVVDNMVYYSTDDLRFLPAEQGPNIELLADGSGHCQIQGPSSSGGAVDTIGPILATEEGFVVLTPAHATDGNRSPLCEPVMWFSTDGGTWELLSTDSPFGEGAAVHEIAVHDGRFVAVGGITHSEEGAIWTSDDGVTWQRANVRLEGAFAVGGGDLGWMITGTAAGSNRGFPAVDMWVSVDGLSWDGPHGGPEGLASFYFRPDLSVGTDAIYAVSATHDTYIIGRLQE